MIACILLIFIKKFLFHQQKASRTIHSIVAHCIDMKISLPYMRENSMIPHTYSDLYHHRSRGLNIFKNRRVISPIVKGLEMLSLNPAFNGFDIIELFA
jgi:hypothetical protein